MNQPYHHASEIGTLLIGRIGYRSALQLLLFVISGILITYCYSMHQRNKALNVIEDIMLSGGPGTAPPKWLQGFQAIAELVLTELQP